jgi:hypothetical protein
MSIGLFSACSVFMSFVLFWACFRSETFRPLWGTERKGVVICVAVFSRKELLMLSHSKVSQLRYERQIENSLLFSSRVSVSLHANDVTQNTWNISIKLYSQIYAILCKTFSFSSSSLHFGNLNLSTTLRIFSRHGKTSLILRERSQNFPYKCVSIYLLIFLYLKNQMKFMALAAKESLANQIRSHTLCWDPVRKAYVLSVLETVWQIWRMSSSCINKKKYQDSHFVGLL